MNYYYVNITRNIAIYFKPWFYKNKKKVDLLDSLTMTWNVDRRLSVLKSTRSEIKEPTIGGSCHVMSHPPGALPLCPFSYIWIRHGDSWARGLPQKIIAFWDDLLLKPPHWPGGILRFYVVPRSPLWTGFCWCRNLMEVMSPLKRGVITMVGLYKNRGRDFKYVYVCYSQQWNGMIMMTPLTCWHFSGSWRWTINQSQPQLPTEHHAPMRKSPGRRPWTQFTLCFFVVLFIPWGSCFHIIFQKIEFWRRFESSLGLLVLMTCSDIMTRDVNDS